MAVLLLTVLLCLAAALGERILALMRVQPATEGYRLTVAAALGLGLAAYAVFALGLIGLLSAGPVCAALAVLAVAAWTGWRGLALDLVGLVRRRPASAESGRALAWVVAVVGLVFGGLVLVNCFVPPGAHEWDALSYHLAAPKVYLQHHRIVFLPTDHHSNFPFLVEMLFTLGLLFDGFTLANLIHFALAALCVSAMLAIGPRLFARQAGLVAALVLITTPIVLWESGAAYIEMGLTLYVLLTVAAAREYREGGDGRWLVLAGAFAGLALSVKALALVPVALVLVFLLARRTPFRVLRWSMLAAIVVGCPFYVKTWVVTGNPVYPYAYRVFGGRYWSQQLADAYAGEQQSFGLDHRLFTPRTEQFGQFRKPEPPTLLDRVRNVLAAPFALITTPAVFYNANDAGVLSQLGYLFLALPPLLLFSRPSRTARWCIGFAALWYLSWALSMQYARYIIPLLPLLGLLGGEGVEKASRAFPGLRYVAGAVIGLQAALALSYFGPRLGANVGIAQGDKGPHTKTYPGQWALATDPEAQAEYLARSVNCYGSEQWLNQNTAPNAGVVLYEETRGFYLDRPYLWGNSGHSLYIPYATFATGQEMAAWFVSHGYRYALVNLQFTESGQTPEGSRKMWEAVSRHQEAELLKEWYPAHLSNSDRSRSLLGDALATGNAVVIPDACFRACVVLELRP